MRISERVHCSRFPVESAAFTPVASPAHVARRATATDAATKIVIVIGHSRGGGAAGFH